MRTYENASNSIKKQSASMEMRRKASQASKRIKRIEKALNTSNGMDKYRHAWKIMEKHPQQRRKASKSIEKHRKHHKASKDVGMHGEASKSMEGHHKASKSVEKHVEKHAKASKSIQWPTSGAAKRTIQSDRTAEPSPKGSKHIKKIKQHNSWQSHSTGRL